MTRFAVLSCLCALLFGCGADGEPHSPVANTAVRSDATIGVSAGTSGTRVVGSLGVNMGPVRVDLGF